ESCRIGDVEDDLRRGKAEALPELSRTSKPNRNEVRPAAGDKEGRLPERAMDSQRYPGPARLLRSDDRLDVGEGDQGPEVPSLAEDDSRARHPVLRHKRRDDEA